MGEIRDMAEAISQQMVNATTDKLTKGFPSVREYQDFMEYQSKLRQGISVPTILMPPGLPSTGNPFNDSMILNYLTRHNLLPPQIGEENLWKLTKVVELVGTRFVVEKAQSGNPMPGWSVLSSAITELTPEETIVHKATQRLLEMDRPDKMYPSALGGASNQSGNLNAAMNQAIGLMGLPNLLGKSGI